jgi:multidrug resistance efflux pump
VLAITNGAYVEQGQVLAELENTSLATECQTLAIAVQKSRAKSRIHLDKKEIAEAQIETVQGEALAKHLLEKRRQLEQLLVRAPLPGRVMARHLELKRGTFLAEGDELLTVADDQRRELQIAIPHEDVEHVVRWVGYDVPVRLPSRGRFIGRLTRISPRAVTTPIHSGLCAPNGGPLAVAPETDRSDEHAPYRLTEPHFTGYVELPRDGRDAPSGEVGVASFQPASSNLAEELIVRLRRCIQRQVTSLARRSQQ